MTYGIQNARQCKSPEKFSNCGDENRSDYNQCFTEEIKFLGFYVMRREGFRKHVEYLRKKAFKRMNIVKALSQTRYGARSCHLRTLKTSAIRSMIEYGTATLNTAIETIFKKLEVLQTTAIRTALDYPNGFLTSSYTSMQAFPIFLTDSAR